MIRFALATALGTVVVAGTLSQPRPWLAIELLTFLAVAALGVGFFAGRPGALAAFLSFVLGLIVSGIVALRHAPPGEGVGASELFWRALPLALVMTLFGWVGGWTRSKIVRP